MIKPKTEHIRVLIVDDHPVFRHGLRDILDSSPGLECAGECASASEALAAVQVAPSDHPGTLHGGDVQDKRIPDIILMDVRMPGHGTKSANGFEATASIKRCAPEVKVIILTMIDSADAVGDAFACGANGYLIKDAGKHELIDAIHEVMNGGTPISPHIRGLQDIFRRAPDLKPIGVSPEDNTERMREMMELLAQGLTNDEIAQRLVLAPKTIRNYVSRVFQSLGADGRRDAIMRLRESGYGAQTSGAGGAGRQVAS